MVKTNEAYPIFLKALCKTCHSHGIYNMMQLKDNTLMICSKENCTNTRPIYVSAKNPKHFIRDYQNNSANRSKTPSMCNREFCENFYQRCTFAHNDSEYFVWVRMVNNKEFKISEIFAKYFQPFVYVISNERKLSNHAVPSIRIHQMSYQPITVPQTPEENMSKQKEENSKIYFCWFCRLNISSEKNIQVHLKGQSHKTNYEADKKRKWYFKMPDKNYLDNFCQHSPCSCDSPHSDDELKEMIARIKFRHFFSKKYSTIIPENYLTSVKKFAPWPEWLQIKVPNFPSRIECYSHPIQTFVTLKICKCRFITLHIFLKDDESRPYFKLINTKNNQSLQYSNQLLTIENSPEVSECTVEFAIEFQALYSSTYRQNIAFQFISETNTVSYLRQIRVDVGTKNHLENFKEKWQKYKILLNHCKVEDRMLIPYKFDEDKFTTSILSEENINYVISMSANDKWIETTVGSHNYMTWMRDMMILEELEQRIILSRLNFQTKIKITNVIEIKDTYNYVHNGKLFGQFQFPSNQDILSRKLFTENSRKGYFTITEKDSLKRRFEFEVANLLDYGFETRSIQGATLCLSKSTVENLQLKSGMELDIHIFMYYDRFHFDKRHKSLNKIPQYDKLSYNPLSCPSFTHLPYGEDESTVVFNPLKSLNEEQKRLPRLVLRKINTNEIALPFVLNGAFGTGKTLLIAETVRKIFVSDPGAHILICTRSASAADIYLEIFSRNVENHRNFITVVRSGRTNEQLDVLYEKYRVLITTLDYASSWTKYEFKKLKTFPYIFVDEAAQVLEVDAIGIFQFGNQHSKFVFAGDIYQTNAEIYNKDLQKFSIPIIRRLYKYYSKVVEYKICLNQVYRTHPKIVEFLSKAIYGSHELTSLMEPTYKSLSPMKFIDSHIDEYQAQFNKDLGCFQNKNEVELIFIEISKLINDLRIQLNEILVCSPFYAQVTLIRRKLNAWNFGNVTVELPSGIQGKEFGFVFLSTVLTSEYLDNQVLHPTFHDSKNLINVVISRAKHSVVVVGEEDLRIKNFRRTKRKEFGFVFLSTVLTSEYLDNQVLHPTFHDSKNLINVVISRAKHSVVVVGDSIGLIASDTWKEWTHFIEVKG